ncbi:hypothetical protein JXA85_02480 [Candidatus Woesearchaeota archaeon]|nr:hypothetical protein [Candidatus Woesearchaeota archaeon]
MTMIKKNVNNLLILLMLLLFLSIVSMTIYYHTVYSKLSNEYYTKAKELDKVTTDLVEHKSKLNETLAQYQIKDEREKDLSAKYTDLRDLNQQVSQDLNQTTLTLQQTKQELDNTKQELVTSVKQIEQKNLEILTLKTSVKNLEQTASEIKTRADQLYDATNALGDAIDGYIASSQTPTSCSALLSDIRIKFTSVEGDVSDIRGLT